MAINKVTLGENTLIDLSGDTVSADKLAEGYTAHDKTGNPITGTMTAGGISINGRTETRYAHGNISAGDFVSSFPYSHSVDVEGEYNFGDKILLAGTHFKDDIYAFVFYQPTFSSSNKIPVMVQLYKMQGGVPVQAGTAYTFQIIHDFFVNLYGTTNSVSKRILIRDKCYKRIINTHGNCLVFCLNNILATLLVDESTLALQKKYEKISETDGSGANAGIARIKDNYYFYQNSDSYNDARRYRYLNAEQIIEINADGTATEGTLYTTGRYKDTFSWGCPPEFEPDGTIYTTNGVTYDGYRPVQHRYSGKAVLYVELSSRAIKLDKPLYKGERNFVKYMNGFYLNNKAYYYYSPSDNFYEDNTVITKEAYERKYREWAIKYDGYQGSYLEFNYNNTNTKPYRYTDKIDIDNKVIASYQNCAFALLDNASALFLCKAQSGDWNAQSTAYRYLGTSNDLSVRPYSGVVYGIAISNPENNYVQVKIPQEA